MRSNLAELKTFFLYCLIGSLIVAATMAVINVLMGEFSEFSIRVLWTLTIVVFHALFSLSFIWDDEKQDSMERLGYFTDVLFYCIIVSFMICLGAAWDMIDGSTFGKLYQSIFVIAFAALHGDVLSKAYGKEDVMDIIIIVNYFVMFAVVVLLLKLIFMGYNFNAYGESLLRVLGAAAIVDGTLSILTIIFYKLYLQKNPDEVDTMNIPFSRKAEPTQKKGTSIWLRLIILYLVIQVLIPIAMIIIYVIGFNVLK